MIEGATGMVFDTVLKLLTDSLIECNNTQETPNARLFLSGEEHSQRQYAPIRP